MGYRVDPTAPTQDQRDEARAAFMIARQELDALENQRKERVKAVLMADAEYQRLFKETTAARERTDRLGSTTRHYKFTVGTSNSMFFTIKAQGDSWEQVIKLIEKTRD
jgi:hypothetical protein